MNANNRKIESEASGGGITALTWDVANYRYVATNSGGGTVNGTSAQTFGEELILSGTNSGKINFREAGGGNTVSLRAPTSFSESQDYILPTTYPSSSGYALVSTDAGQMSWAAFSGGNSYITSLTWDAPNSRYIATLSDSTTVTGATANIFGAGASISLKSTTHAGRVDFYEKNGNELIRIRAPDTVSGIGQIYTLPDAYPTSSGYSLVSTTAGVMSWAANSDANYYVTGGTYSAGSIDFSGTTSFPTFSVTGIPTGTTTASNIQTFTNKTWNGVAIGDTYISSASNWNDAYNNYVASAAYSAGTLTFTQRDGGTFTATGFSQATGSVTGGGADNRIAHWTSATNVTGTSDLTYDGSKLILGSQGKVIVKYNDEDPKESTEILHVVTSGTEASFAIEAQSASSGVKNMALLPNLSQNIKNLGQYWDTQFSPTYSDIYEWGYNGDASSANRNLYFKTVLAYPILFSTSNTERMRITSAGDVAIGHAVPATKLDVLGSITAGANSYTTISNNEYDVSSGDLLFDVAGDITLDAGGSDIKLSKAGGNKASFYLTTSDVYFGTKASDGDFYITGSDGGSQVTALHFDMSEVGLATFSTTPVVGTMTSSDNSTKAASTAYVTTAVAANTGTPGGSDTQVQYNNGGSFGGTDNLYWIDASDR